MHKMTYATVYMQVRTTERTTTVKQIIFLSKLW